MANYMRAYRADALQRSRYMTKCFPVRPTVSSQANSEEFLALEATVNEGLKYINDLQTLHFIRPEFRNTEYYREAEWGQASFQEGLAWLTSHVGDSKMLSFDTENYYQTDFPCLWIFGTFTKRTLVVHCSKF